MGSLKAQLRQQPRLASVPFSTNDIAIGLFWMLRCDAKGWSRPFQDQVGSIRTAVMRINASEGRTKHLAPPGFFGNLAFPARIECHCSRHLPLQQRNLPEVTNPFDQCLARQG